MTTVERKASRHEWLLLAGAVAWSVLLLPLAVWLPVETSPTSTASPGGPTTVPMESLVRVNGHRILLVVVIPLVVSLVVGVSMVLSERGWALAGGVAWSLSVGLTIAAVVGTVTFLIGIYVLPVGILLVACCGVRRSRHRALPDWTR